MDEYNNLPLVSIIIPVYNVEKYIDDCIQSVLAQTYKNIEILVVDDGSPDYSIDRIEKYQEKDSRIKIIRQKNMGLSGARNTGIEAASGEWLYFLDSDDFLFADAIEKLLRKALEKNVKLSMCGYVYVDEECPFDTDDIKAHAIRTVELQDQLIDNPYDMHKFFLDRRGLMCYVWMKLYHKSIWTDLRFPLGKKYEDIYVFGDILELAGSMVMQNTFIYGYRNRPTSICHDTSIENIQVSLLHFNQWRSILEEKYPDLVNEMNETILETCILRFGRTYEEKNTNKKIKYQAISEIYDSYRKGTKITTFKLRVADILYHISPGLAGLAEHFYLKWK